MKKKTKQTIGGILIEIGIITTIAFVILRLMHIIDWQWVWILSPMWISITLNLIISIIIEIINTIRKWYDINKIR